MIGSILGAAAGLLGGGGGGSVSQTTSTKPWKPQQGYYKDIFSQASQQYHDPASTVAGFTAPQVAGQEAAMDYANTGMSHLLGEARQGIGTFLDPGMLDIYNNPYAVNAMSAAVNPIFTRLLEEVLPSITSGAQQVGGIGGTRQGIAEGKAIGDTTQAAMDTTAAMASRFYQNALNQMMQASTYAPSIANAGLAPAQTMMDIGGMQQAQQQRVLDEPAQRLAQYANLIGAPKGSTSTTTLPTPRGNPLMSALGGYLVGGQLFPGGSTNPKMAFSSGGYDHWGNPLG